jgi:uncharacterized protein YndB with AHSA1/START domain
MWAFRELPAQTVSVSLAVRRRVEARPERVYDAVSDLARMAAWSGVHRLVAVLARCRAHRRPLRRMEPQRLAACGSPPVG